MGKFIENDGNYINLDQVTVIEGCGTPRESWYRVYLSDGTYIDLDDAVWLQIQREVRANSKPKRKLANTPTKQGDK